MRLPLMEAESIAAHETVTADIAQLGRRVLDTHMGQARRLFPDNLVF